MSSERLNDALVANLAVWASDAKPTAHEVEALAREVQESRAEIERLRALVDDYENGISWYTTCTNCAKLMDVNYDQYCQIERLRAAGDALAEVSLGARPWITPLFAMEHGNRISAATAAWQEARREQ